MQDPGLKARQRILPYLDADGLVAPRKTKPGEVNVSGNGLMYLAEHVLDLRVIDPQAHSGESFRRVVKSCWKDGIVGLLNRSPTHRDQEGPDDLIAVAAADSWVAYCILDYGKNEPARIGPMKLRYFYNNVRPGTCYHRDGKRLNWSAWLGRQPQVVAHLHWCAGKRPPLWMRVWWCLVIGFTGILEPRSEDAWRLSRILVWSASLRGGWMERVAIRIWARRLLKHWPGGMPEVKRSYFSFEHPLVLSSRETGRLY